MSERKSLTCPNCGTTYSTEEQLEALIDNEGYCTNPNCGCDLAAIYQDDDVWFDFFTDGKIDGDIR